MSSHSLRYLLQLLDMESKAEAQRAAEQARRMSPADAQRTGNTLIDLAVADEDVGLGGRFLVRFTRSKRGPLPWTRLDTGSPVVMSPDHARPNNSYPAIVSERFEDAIVVALEHEPADLADHECWRLDASFDEVAIRRQRQALQNAETARGDRKAILRDVLLGIREPEFGRDPTVRPLDGSLNKVQIDAVQFALSARDVGLIHGPPGTGKTTAVVEVIRQAIRKGRKVLACAPSNTAVDNIFQRLLALGERAVRLGHPPRVLPDLRAHTLDLLVENHPDVKVARRLAKQAMSLFRDAGKYKRAKPFPGQRQQTRADAKSLLADARHMERQAAESILGSASVLCVTTTGVDPQVLGDRRFDLCVIDEACQSTEPGCWIPILRCDRLVLAGDHCQLPPTIISKEAAAAGFNVSLFERLMNQHGPVIARRLEVQYRMHQAIMDFSSREFYDSALVAAPSVCEHVLFGLPDVQDVPFTRTPLEFIDTAGASYDECQEPDGESRMNPEEARLVQATVDRLLGAGVPPAGIAVIAPYAAQVRLLRERLSVPGLEIDSVDGFQGREKEAVVISLVRSNPSGEIGFLSDVRRMNVAMTRARRKLIIVGDSSTLATNAFYSRMIDYFQARGAYTTVWEMQGQ